MTVRGGAGDERGIPSGYAGVDVPGDISIPSCGIEDVDRALFQTFDSEIGFQVSRTTDGVRSLAKIPVFLGVGEKWALNKKRKGIRDKSGTLILPLISIVRTSIDQKVEQDQLGRGINQAVGDLVVKRRISSVDREYQNLVNKNLIPNQDNLPTGSLGSPVSSGREVGLDRWNSDVLKGNLLANDPNRAVWEIITIPTPQFYTSNYEVTFWAQYTEQMNEMIERLMASMLPQLPALKLTTPKGYWFVAYLNGDFKSTANIDDLNENERVMKYVFTLSVRAYTVAPSLPGMPSPVRRYVSSPEVSFDVSGEVQGAGGSEVQSPTIDGADDPTLGYTLDGEVTPRPTAQRGSYSVRVTKNPFTKGSRAEYVKVVSVNAKSGESIVRSINPGIEIELD